MNCEHGCNGCEECTDYVDFMVGRFPEPTERELKLRALAVRYITETEAFDRTVCTGPIGRSGILPATPQELGAINRHAIHLLGQLAIEARAIDFDRSDLLEAIQREERR